MIQVVNLPQVLAALGATQAKLKTAEPIAERGGAQIVARLAQGFAPRQTGRLASSIRAQGSEVVAGEDYSGYQEYGTSFHGAQPYLEPASKAAEGPFFAISTAIFSKAVL